MSDSEFIVETKLGLAHYDQAHAEIKACIRLDEVKDIRDKAEALRLYARQAGDREAERNLLKIRCRAERRAGQMLREMAASGERERRGGDRKSKFAGETLIPKLEDLGISKAQSHDWQKLAGIAEKTFEEFLDSGETFTEYERLRDKAKAASEPRDGFQRMTALEEERMADADVQPITVHFESVGGKLEFGRLIGLEVTTETSSVWFPALGISRYRN